jgi:glycosyltransferase involved in cell wall biosynthesis
MRVAFLSCSAPAGDAIGNQLAEKTAFFLEHGADVRVFLESDWRLHPALRDLSFRARQMQRTQTDESQEDENWKFVATADLIFVDYSQYYESLDWLPLLAGGKARIILDYHGVTPPQLWGSCNREGIEKGVRQRGLVWCADAALVHSRFAEKELRAATGFPENWIHRLGHPVDLERFSPGSPRFDWRQRLGLGPVKLLLFVGRMAQNKRVPILIDALALMKENRPAVHTIVVGDSSDAYAVETHRCRQRAADLGVSERVHFVGHLCDEDLLEAYRSADIFVMPSIHEGFCIPVLEAMACGVPVVAARAAALPETIGSAGLTFIPDDAHDLARVVLRVLASERDYMAVTPVREGETPPPVAPSPLLRVAFVAFRYGTDFVGGAESSLRTAARALHDKGHHVEVFTTCTRSDGHWRNELPEGSSPCDGMPLHRFPIDPHDRARHLESIRRILQQEDQVPLEVEQEYLKHSIHSIRLVEELRRRESEFDAIVVGPYIHGLTWDVAREFSKKVIVVPCFHDEPYARFHAWQSVYGRVGGIWYHSEEENQFAETELGLNHPGGMCIGTWLDTLTMGDGERGREHVGTKRPYLVYCGRFSQEKNLPCLLDFAERYNAAKPGRFTFVFLGEGAVKVPDEDWTKNLGYVNDAVKRDLLTGAAALIQFSRFESLSLVALEAWAQGIPVLADGRCTVLAGHLQRCGGGTAIDSFDSFAAALDDLWSNAAAWHSRGREGQKYVREHYGCRDAYTNRLEHSIRELEASLIERMRRRGLERATLHGRLAWRGRWAEFVEEILDCPRRPMRHKVEVVPRTESLTVSSKQESILVPARISNRGTHAVVAGGPGRCLVRSRVVYLNNAKKTGSERETEESADVDTTALPDLLMPGQTLPAVVRLPVPPKPGDYRVEFQIVRERELSEGNRSLEDSAPATLDPMSARIAGSSSMMELHVQDRPADAGGFAPLLEEIRKCLVEASQLQRLPDDYIDITEGRLAKWKRWIKRKLLGNFKHAYVDVLSRQQSRFNQQVLTAITELADYCAALEHAIRADISGGRGSCRAAEPGSAGASPSRLGLLTKDES